MFWPEYCWRPFNFVTMVGGHTYAGSWLHEVPINAQGLCKVNILSRVAHMVDIGSNFSYNSATHRWRVLQAKLVYQESNVEIALQFWGPVLSPRIQSTVQSQVCTSCRPSQPAAWIQVTPTAVCKQAKTHYGAATDGSAIVSHSWWVIRIFLRAVRSITGKKICQL